MLFRENPYEFIDPLVIAEKAKKPAAEDSAEPPKG